MGYLWKLTAKRNNSTLKKGMNIEIMTKSINKPSQKEIANAINDKYNSNVHFSHCDRSGFDIEKLS